MVDLTKTYWFHNGKHEAIKGELEKMIPGYGEVHDASNNSKLELFRRASNVYYDLYNNGLCNLQDEFREIFGIDGWNEEITQEIVNATERRTNAIIVDAAKEQGLWAVPRRAEVANADTNPA